MTTTARGLIPESRVSWPFPAAANLRKIAAAPPAPTPEEDNRDASDGVDAVEQELVKEQQERDREASRAVDPNVKDRAEP